MTAALRQPPVRLRSSSQHLQTCGSCDQCGSGVRWTRRWRKPDSNSESRSEKVFHAEPMVCTTLRWRKTDSNHRFLDSSADVVKTAVRSPHDGLTVSRPGTRSLNPSPATGESVSAVNSGAVGEKPGVFAPVCTANGTREGDELAEHLLIWPFLSEGH